MPAKKNLSTRQMIRRALITVSFLSFPITIFYHSPVLPIQAATLGILSGSALLFLAQLISGLIFGRLFCGYLCPAGGLQEICMRVNNRSYQAKRLKWFKYVVWAPMLMAIVAMLTIAGGIKSLDPLFATQNGISVHEVQHYIVYYAVVGLISALSVTMGRRFFCHSMCWMAPFMQTGMAIRRKLNTPALHLAARRDDCIHCKQCNTVCPMSLPVMDRVATGIIDDWDCILCGACVDTCPKRIIHYRFNTTDRVI